MKLDERFLSPHPRTRLWWEQRQQCERCRHHVKIDSTEKLGGQWSCLAVGGGGGKNGSTACINAREDNMPCGPDAKLFEEAP